MGKNYGTKPRTMEHRFTKEKNIVDYLKLKFISENAMVIYQNN